MKISGWNPNPLKGLEKLIKNNEVKYASCFYNYAIFESQGKYNLKLRIDYSDMKAQYIKQSIGNISNNCILQYLKRLPKKFKKCRITIDHKEKEVDEHFRILFPGDKIGLFVIDDNNSKKYATIVYGQKYSGILTTKFNYAMPLNRLLNF